MKTILALGMAIWVPIGAWAVLITGQQVRAVDLIIPGVSSGQVKTL